MIIPGNLNNLKIMQDVFTNDVAEFVIDASMLNEDVCVKILPNRSEDMESIKFMKQPVFICFPPIIYGNRYDVFTTMKKVMGRCPVYIRAKYMSEDFNLESQPLTWEEYSMYRIGV